MFGWRADGLPGFPLLVRRNRRLDFDPRASRPPAVRWCAARSTNVLHGLSRLALGRPSITPRLIERLYDERTRPVRPARARRAPAAAASARRRQPLTWAALAPLALPDLPEEIGRRLVEEHLLDPSRFWLPVAPPSVAADDPSFSRRDRLLFLRRYWRGPTWVNAAWLLWLGLVRLGYDDAATEMAQRLTGAVRAAGLREYYDPYTRSRAWARATSPGRRWRSSSPIPTRPRHEPPAALTGPAGARGALLRIRSPGTPRGARSHDRPPASARGG